MRIHIMTSSNVDGHFYLGSLQVYHARSFANLTFDRVRAECAEFEYRLPHELRLVLKPRISSSSRCFINEVHFSNLVHFQSSAQVCLGEATTLNRYQFSNIGILKLNLNCKRLFMLFHEINRRSEGRVLWCGWIAWHGGQCLASQNPLSQQYNLKGRRRWETVDTFLLIFERRRSNGKCYGKVS